MYQWKLLQNICTMFNLIVQVWERQEAQENFPAYHRVSLGLEWTNPVTWTSSVRMVSGGDTWRSAPPPLCKAVLCLGQQSPLAGHFRGGFNGEQKERSVQGHHCSLANSQRSLSSFSSLRKQSNTFPLLPRFLRHTTSSRFRHCNIEFAVCRVHSGTYQMFLPL